MEESSLAARYCVVLEELRSEAIEQIERCQSLRAAGFDGEVVGLSNSPTDIVRVPNGSSNIHQATTFGNLPGPDASFDFNTNLETSLADFSNWVQFESMVRTHFASNQGMIFISLTDRVLHRPYPALQILG